MSRLTADEARKLADDKTIQDLVDDILSKVREAAEKKERHIIVRNDFISLNGYHHNASYNHLEKTLQSLGYKVKFNYSEMSYGVDMYLEVQW